MFDVSHMARVRVRGTGALDVLQHLGTNDLTKVAPGRAQYTVWCTPDGGAIDDIINLWLAPDDFIVVMNASRHTDDLAHLEEHAAARDVTIVDETGDTVMIAVQGPEARSPIATSSDATRCASKPRTVRHASSWVSCARGRRSRSRGTRSVSRASFRPGGHRSC